MAGTQGSWGPALGGVWTLIKALPRGWWGVARNLDGQTPLSLLRLRADEHGERAALIDAEGTWTYAELAAAVADASQDLRHVRTVIIASSSRSRVLVGVLAAITTGCRTIVMSRRAGSQAVDTLTASHPRAAVIGDGPELIEAPPHQDEDRREGGKLATAYEALRIPTLIFATSGTTGTPKLIDADPGGGPQLFSLLGRLSLPRSPVVCCLAPLDHGHGGAVALVTLALGGTVVTDASQVAQVDLLTGVPVQLLELARAQRRPVPGRAKLRARVVLSGSDRLTDAEADELADAFRADVFNAYGSTETATVCVADAQDRRRAPGTVGRPLAGVQIVAVDDEGRPVGSGVTGRLRITVGSQREGRTFEGDAGFVDAHGYVHVAGRADGVRVSGGENTSPVALEAWLTALPGVREVRLVEVPDARFGHRLIAKLYLEPGVQLDSRTLRERLADELGPANVPARIDLY